jgi:tetratricopeptide (TPR) repeat protein
MDNRNQMDMNDTQRRPVQDLAGTPAAAPAIPATNASTFSRVINWSLALLVFAVPLLFLPFTSEALEFNKQTLIFLAVVVMLGFWVIKILTTRSVSWVKTSLDYILLAYVVVLAASSFLSLDKVSSFLGYYGRFNGSFLSIISFVVLYYIIVNNVRTPRVTGKLLKVLLVSGGLVLLYGLLQVFGLHVIPLGFAKSVSFNTIGSLVSLSIFSALMVIMSQWAWLTQPGRYGRIFYPLMSVAGLLLMFLINAFIGWLILALGMIVFMALAMVITNQQNSQMWIWKPLLVLVVSILFVGFNFLPNSVNPRSWVGDIVQLPVEIQLSASSTWEMTKNALSAKPILGFGPGTTGIAFGQIKPENLNQTIVWSLNFDRASSEIANIAIETGLLGLLAFEAASVLFLLYALFFLLRRGDHPGRMQAFGVFVVWLALYVSHFFYFYNTVMYFLFWLLLALFMAITHWKQSQAEDTNLSFTESPRSALSWMFASLLALAVLLVGGFFQIAVYFADTAYASGLKALNQQEPDFAKATDMFANAVNRNQYRDVYYLAYGQTLVYRAALEARKEKPDVAQFQRYIQDIITAGNRATSLSPNKASNWSSRTQFYSQIRALSVPGTNDVIISSAEEAVKKDDRNPIRYMQLAQAYANSAETIDATAVAGTVDTDGDGLGDEAETALGSNPKDSDSNGNNFSDGDEVKAGFNPGGTGRLTAQQLAKYTRIDQDKLRKAEEALNKVIELKNNLPDSYISLSRVYERWGKLDNAKTTLEKGITRLPANSDMKFELGRVFFNLRQINEAEKLFKEVVKLVDNHANAHYSLGLVALQKNDRAAALVEFEKTLEIVGPNADLERLIEQTKNPPAAQ